MKTIAIAGTMIIDAETLARIVAEELGMQPADISRPASPLDPFEEPRLTIPDLDGAIAAVIRATDKLDRDQHTRGEHTAIIGLFTAAKQLRLAVRQIKSVSSREGKNHA